MTDALSRAATLIETWALTLPTDLMVAIGPDGFARLAESLEPACALCGHRGHHGVCGEETGREIGPGEPGHRFEAILLCDCGGIAPAASAEALQIVEAWESTEHGDRPDSTPGGWMVNAERDALIDAITAALSARHRDTADRAHIALWLDCQVARLSGAEAIGPTAQAEIAAKLRYCAERLRAETIAPIPALTDEPAVGRLGNRTEATGAGSEPPAGSPETAAASQC